MKRSAVRHPSRSAISLRAVIALATGLVIALVGAAHAGAADQDRWSPEEMQFAYELNRARWDPTTVEARAGLPDGAILPAPPLAISYTLAGAAGFRSNEMAQLNYFGHQSPATGKWPNQVARDFGYRLPSFWPNAANNIESIHRGSPTVLGVLQSFVDSATHRAHLMGQGWFATHEEIGVGAHLGDRIWTILTATESTNILFITGVVYADRNANRVMDLGEGLSGVTVATGGRSTITNAGGGWSLPVVAGRYRVTASGGSFAGESSTTIRVTRFNVGVDFVSGEARSSLGKPQVYSYRLCNGLRPTILGTNRRDVIVGTPGDDVIHGGAGHDRIDGGGGNDTICGGPGNDTLIGRAGRDTLIGGGGLADRCIRGEQNSSCELP